MLNYNAVVAWALGAIIGYLIADSFKGALIGLAIALALSLLASMLPTPKSRRNPWGF